MAKLKRSLFIGLGGTGLKSILHTKKRFIDTYGEIPPMTAFLAFDTDGDSINTKIDSNIGGQRIGLDASEFLHIRVRDPQEILRQQPDLFDFVPTENRPLLISLTDGAGQVRSNGRFATHFNYSAIESAIRTKLTSILNADAIGHDKYEVNGSDVEINMMFSVAGGTGSGTFLDMAYIVKEVSKGINATVEVSTIGFAILPDVFNAMMNGPAMANVLPNGYGALHDLDFLMHHNYDKKPLEIKYSTKTLTIEKPPFDLVFTINNIDKNANTYTNVNDLSELIGLAMFTGASELSGGMASSYDNVRNVIAQRVMDVENKKSWACGLGLSELYYDGNKLGNIYAHKASTSIINNLITPETDSFNLDDIFIDDAKIRENNGDANDELIDSLLSVSPKIQYSFINDVNSIDSEVNAYLVNVEDSAKTDISSNYIIKETDVNKKLNSFIIEHINKSSGVGNIDRFLNALAKHVQLFLEEMKSEQVVMSENDKLYKNQLNQTISELKGLSFLEKKFGPKLNNAKEDVIQSVNLIASNIHELLRRQYAITFFNKLLLMVGNHEENVKNIIQKLEQVEEECESKFIGLQNQINEQPKKFVKELHRDFVNSVKVSDKDLNISDFINSISVNTDGLYDFSEVSTKLISESFWRFSKELPKALEYRNKNINEVLSTYSEDELNKIIKELITKSNPLWSYNYKGHVINRQHHEAFIIGVPNVNSSVINKDTLSNILESNQRADFNSTSMHDRIVIYRMEATVPAYAVSNMTLYKEKRDSSRISHHIDQNWLLRMDREGFDIYPTKREDHSLEYWVTGFIYDFIKYEGENYLAYSEEKGDPIEDYWIELGTYRDEAFTEFKRLKLQDEFKSMIDSKIADLGEIENQKLIKEVSTSTNYNEHYSKKNFENSELKDSKMIKVKELFSDEINFVKKVLAK
ncbi:tubulin-like doman-containing protein [Polaribacter atrinae]|uniref:tubulin-like doman-containing protein n=1 Tax=Polaribacter atrinae TaxID=1333662 RepID=UPI00248FA0FA|nr:tubulin-like doman-containing protein [Polaribacter atrinae]